MGVWIEIIVPHSVLEQQIVTPLVGVWIEIISTDCPVLESASLPLWECGLKFNIANLIPDFATVTPLVGVWIEIHSPEV